MGQSQTAKVIDISDADPLFARMRTEADDILRREPILSKLMLTAVLNHHSLEAAVIYRIAARLDHGDVPGLLLSQAFTEVVRHDPSIAEAFRADLLAVFDRDPRLHPARRAAFALQRLPRHPDASFRPRAVAYGTA